MDEGLKYQLLNVPKLKRHWLLQVTFSDDFQLGLLLCSEELYVIEK